MKCKICDKEAMYGYGNYCSKEHRIIHENMYVGETLQEYKTRHAHWLKHGRQLRSKVDV